MQTDESDSLVGFDFHPSDQPLVGYYLYQKVTSQKPLDFSTTIQECDLYEEKEPWEIWETYGGNVLKPKQDLYFFTRLKKKSVNSKRINRTIGSGTWKGEDSGKPIFVRGFQKQMGFKKLFRYEDRCNQSCGWILHEYSLDSWVLEQATDYVLCRLRKKTDKKRFAAALDEDIASSKHSEVEETPVRVEGTTHIHEQVAKYGLAISELGSHVHEQVAEYGLAISELGDLNETTHELEQVANYGLVTGDLSYPNGTTHAFEQVAEYGLANGELGYPNGTFEQVAEYGLTIGELGYPYGTFEQGEEYGLGIGELGDPIH